MTLPLRTRLTVFYTIVFGILLTALAAVSYRALGQQLDSDATRGLIELTNGLHGYLHFETGTPEVRYDSSDPQETAFVQRATRFYQIYDGRTGGLLVQSDAIEPLGLDEQRPRPPVVDLIETRRALDEGRLLWIAAVVLDLRLAALEVQVAVQAVGQLDQAGGRV